MQMNSMKKRRWSTCLNKWRRIHRKTVDVSSHTMFLARIFRLLHLVIDVKARCNRESTIESHIATMVTGQVLRINSDDDKVSNELCKNQYYQQLNQGIQDLIPPKPRSDVRIDRAKEVSLIWETRDPDPYYDF